MDDIDVAIPELRPAATFVNGVCVRAPDGAAVDRVGEVERALEVGELLMLSGVRMMAVVAGMMVGVLERGIATREAVEERFGLEVGALSAALCGDRRIADEEERLKAVRSAVRGAGDLGLVLLSAELLVEIRGADRVEAPLSNAWMRHARSSLAMFGTTNLRAPHIENLVERVEARSRQRASPFRRPFGGLARKR